MAPKPSAAPKNGRKCFQMVWLSYFHSGSIPPRCLGREKWKLTHVETNTFLIFRTCQWATTKEATWSFMHLSRLKKNPRNKRQLGHLLILPPGWQCEAARSPLGVSAHIWSPAQSGRGGVLPAAHPRLSELFGLGHKQAPGQLQVRAGAHATATLSSCSSKTRQPGHSTRQQYLHKQL